MIKTPNVLNNLKDVDVASPTEDNVLTYNAVTKLWGAEAVAGSGTGDMTKAVYDTNNDGVVDNSEKLEASTKVQVQDHAPKSHTHVEADVTDLDHDAQKIKSKTVDAPLEADDDKFLQYDHLNSKFVLTAGGGGGATTFLGLTDTPSVYTGKGGKAVKVKVDETGLEFGDCPPADISYFAAYEHSSIDKEPLSVPKPVVGVLAELVV